MPKKISGNKGPEQQNNASPSSGLGAQTNGNGMENRMSGGDTDISTDEIAARAYEIYEREGRSDGRDMDHWLRAESELRQEREQRQASPQLRQDNPQSRQDLPRSARQHQPTTGV